uniref:Uncharacterized protein n=1 Tax=Arundo donax TaxID=35708 RepID=A0A0A9FWU7_ARUDO
MLHSSDDIAGKAAERESFDAQTIRSRCTRIKSLLLFREASSNKSEESKSESQSSSCHASSASSESSSSCRLLKLLSGVSDVFPALLVDKVLPSVSVSSATTCKFGAASFMTPCFVTYCFLALSSDEFFAILTLSAETRDFSTIVFLLLLTLDLT